MKTRPVHNRGGMTPSTESKALTCKTQPLPQQEYFS